MNNIFIGRKKYKIVNRKKFIRFLFIICLVLLSIVLIFLKKNKVYSLVYENEYIEIEVVEGDTLWDIARLNMPKDYDIRKMVIEIKEFNNMKDAYIYPGDLIKIPIK